MYRESHEYTHTFDNNALVKLLNERFVSHRLTYRKASLQSGISRATLNRLRKGVVDPDVSTILALCNWLNTDPSTILGWKRY